MCHINGEIEKQKKLKCNEKLLLEIVRILFIAYAGS